MKREEFGEAAAPYMARIADIIPGAKVTIVARVPNKDFPYVVTMESGLDEVKAGIDALHEKVQERKATCESEQSSEQASETKEKAG